MTKDDIKLILEEFRKKNRFSKLLGFSHLLTTASYFFNSTKLYKRSLDLREKAIFRYLNVYLERAFENNKDKLYSTNVDFSKEPIFVCWFQGEENAPKLVKKCLSSIRKNAGTHEVKFISLENIGQYITVPDYIMQKFLSGDICAANLSDYFRNCLLFKYGGLWLDATIFCHSSIPEWIFQKDFYTVKFGYDPNSKNISKGRWTGFVIGGRKNYPFFGFFKDCFEEYWKNESDAIDYFVLDYCIDYFYNNMPSYKEDIDSIPINNPSIFKLQQAMKEGIPYSDWHFDKNTFLYKLSWHTQFKTFSENNDETVYKRF